MTIKSLSGGITLTTTILRDRLQSALEMGVSIDVQKILEDAVGDTNVLLSLAKRALEGDEI
jgi:hypothetical protein